MKRLTISGIVLAVLMLAIIGCSNHHGPTGTDDTNDVSAHKLASSIPADAVLDGATMFLYAIDSDTQSVTAHAVSSAWTETAVTWNSFAGGFVAKALDTTDVAGAGWYTFDVTDAAKGWFDSTLVNYGLFLQQVGPDTAITRFASREAGSGPPFLEVCYSTWEGSKCDTLAAMGDVYIYSVGPDLNYATDTILIVGADPGNDSTYQTLVTFDFPVEIRYVSLGDFVWLDMNKDGIQDAGEMGVEGVTVNLYDCADNLLATDITDANGGYLFDELLGGDYKLEYILPENMLFSPRDMGGNDLLDSDVDPATGLTDCMTLMPSWEQTTVDAGLYPAPASLGDFVFNDENWNGIQDDTEMGLADIMVKLYDCEGNMVAETMTDADGMYMFDGVRAGEYYLEYVNPLGWIFTLQDEGDDDALDSDVDRYTKRTVCFELTAGQEAHDWDAGLYEFDGCTYSKGYWKNHAGFGPQADVLTMLLPIWLGNDDGDKSMAVTDATIAVDVLHQHTYDHPRNGITKLYAQLLAAKLNIMNFANPEDIQETIEDADDFLADHDYMDWESLEKEDQKMVLKWKGALDDYNNGETGPGHCDDHDDDNGDEN